MNLSADCSRCAALCCSAFAFEAGPDFGADKPAEQLCAHLGKDFGCTIHAERAARGYRGCIDYDCQGAGPAATGMFPPARADEDPALRRARYESFRIFRTIHALAATLRRSEIPEALRAQVMPQLDPDSGWTYPRLVAFDRSNQRSEILKRIAAELRPAARVPSES